MRVLYGLTHHRGGGGAENAAYTTMEAAARNGMEVRTFIRKSAELPGGLRGRVLACVNVLYAPGCLQDFESDLRSFQPDVVHLYDLFPLISPWVIPLCARYGVPVVVDCQQYRLTCPITTHFRDGKHCTLCCGNREYWAVLKNCRHNLPESLIVALYNLIGRRAGLYRKHVSRFIAPSEFMRQWLIRAGTPAEKIMIVTPMVRIPEQAADAGNGRYVAFGGRFVPEKGVRVAVEAAELLGDVPFVLCRNQAYLVKVEVPPSVQVVVTRDRQELDDVLRHARLLVAPSTFIESFGLLAAEAMAHGIPVVASRIGALAELVQDGVDGLLVEPGDPRDLAAKVARLWNAPDLCRQYGAAARRKALAGWGPERHFASLKLVYDSVLPHPAAGPLSR